MNNFVWLLSHHEVNQYLAFSLGAAFELGVQVPLLVEALPDSDCRALVVDLDSVAPARLALRQLVKELSERTHPYPVAAFGHSLEDDQIIDLRAAGILVFQHCLGPAIFAAIAEQLPDGPPVHRTRQTRFPTNTNGFVWLLSHGEVNQDLAHDLGVDQGLEVQVRFLKDGLPDGSSWTWTA
jgi:hypothetical protein